MFQVKMKNGISALLLMGLLFSGFYVSAQKTDPAKASQAMTDKMKTQLNLSEEQYQKVAVANLDFSKAISEIRNSGAGRTEKMSRMKDLNQKRDASLKSILNEEQYSRFKAQQKEHRKAMRARRNAEAE